MSFQITILRALKFPTVVNMKLINQEWEFGEI